MVPRFVVRKALACRWGALCFGVLLLSWAPWEPGFWPEEIAAVDRAGASGGARGELEQPDRLVALAIRAGRAAFGRGELGPRLGVALLAGIALALTWAGARASGSSDREVAIAVILLASSPGFLLQARLVSGRAGALVAGAGIALGVGLACGAGRRRGRALGAAIAAAGVALLVLGQRPEVSLAWGRAGPGFAWLPPIERIGYAAFPWVALIPLALAGTRRWPWVLVVAAWVAATLWSPRLADAALPPLAVAVASGLRAPRARSPAAAASAAVIAIVLGRDLTRFPGTLAELGTGRSVPIAVGDWLGSMPAAAGLLVAVAALAAASRRASRRAVAGAVAIGVAHGAVMVVAWFPAASAERSPKPLYQHWQRVREREAPIALWRASERAAEEYAPGAVRVASGRAELADWLAAPGRDHAIIAGGELCALRADAIERGARVFAVAGDLESRLLVTDHPRGARDRGPLAGKLLHRPGDGRAALASFDGRVELVGVELPPRVSRGDAFHVTLEFRVARPLRRSWKVFAHFDGPGGHFKGDHEPIGGACSPRHWRAGDVVVDRFEVEAGNLIDPEGTYEVWVGLFVGSHGNWTNMPVRSGRSDDEDRLYIGSIEVH